MSHNKELIETDLTLTVNVPIPTKNFELTSILYKEAKKLGLGKKDFSKAKYRCYLLESDNETYDEIDLCSRFKYRTEKTECQDVIFKINHDLVCRFHTPSTRRIDFIPFKDYRYLDIDIVEGVGGTFENCRLTVDVIFTPPALFNKLGRERNKFFKLVRKGEQELGYRDQIFHTKRSSLDIKKTQPLYDVDVIRGAISEIGRFANQIENNGVRYGNFPSWNPNENLDTNPFGSRQFVFDNLAKIEMGLQTIRQAIGEENYIEKVGDRIKRQLSNHDQFMKRNILAEFDRIKDSSLEGKLPDNGEIILKTDTLILVRLLERLDLNLLLIDAAFYPNMSIVTDPRVIILPNTNENLVRLSSTHEMEDDIIDINKIQGEQKNLKICYVDVGNLLGGNQSGDDFIPHLRVVREGFIFPGRAEFGRLLKSSEKFSDSINKVMKTQEEYDLKKLEIIQDVAYSCVAGVFTALQLFDKNGLVNYVPSSMVVHRPFRFKKIDFRYLPFDKCHKKTVLLNGKKGKFIKEFIVKEETLPENTISYAVSVCRDGKGRIIGYLLSKEPDPYSEHIGCVVIPSKDICAYDVLDDTILISPAGFIIKY